MYSRTDEILLITQEECAEVTQAVSKILRFGMTSEHPVTKIKNKDHLTEEVGDLLAMIEIMVEFKILDQELLSQACANKKQKLLKWSKIYDKEN